MRRIFAFAVIIYLSSCSVQKQIGKSASIVLEDSTLSKAHVGISIYDPESGKYLYNYNAENYFVPASNTKIPTCYAAMKYLEDSLTGLWYYKLNDSSYRISPTGDPTFLLPEFPYQPVYNFFQIRSSYTYYYFNWKSVWKENGLGSGWSWDDYMEPYMAERSPFPIYGNLLKIKRNLPPEDERFSYGFRSNPRFDFGPLFPVPVNIDSNMFLIKRELGANRFFVYPSEKRFDSVTLTISEPDNFFQFKYLLADTTFWNGSSLFAGKMINDEDTIFNDDGKTWLRIKSQPTDSMLKPMMHRSDNFFAEQTLLMVSREKLGIMNDAAIIDTILKTDFKDIPQKPRWADGSGLSRYNLFTPQDFVFILNKMKNEFGMDRIKVILPTGGEGTLSNYYIANKDRFFAKTGTLSGVVALSGFMYTRKNKLLIFSVLVNNHRGSAPDIRRKVEKFLQNICNR
jgi:serine-type D-Ala-D-Ala carboxypeptidase/endopeptidase (penicillin-binding protein 4)